jgi:hypothetical protein
MSTYAITTKIEIPASRVGDLVCCALEGGSTYWCEDFNPKEYPEGCEWGHEAVAHGVPFDIWLEDEPRMRIKNSPARIAATLQLMAEKFPYAWQDFINENEDSSTGDLFFQLLCFGEEVYG